MSRARENILQRLRDAGNNVKLTPTTNWQPPLINKADSVAHFKKAMEPGHTQIITTTVSAWPESLLQLASEHKLKNWLVSAESASGQAFAKYAKLSRKPLTVTPYDKSFALMKDTLFHSIDASLTEAAAAIVDTGTLLLLPSAAEPRTMSLVPPVHVALLRTSTLVSNFNELIEQQRWPNSALPTNALLISGPSKTADIQQTLAYGAHGPKALFVLLIHDDKATDSDN